MFVGKTLNLDCCCCWITQLVTSVFCIVMVFHKKSALFCSEDHFKSLASLFVMVAVKRERRWWNSWLWGLEERQRVCLADTWVAPSYCCRCRSPVQGPRTSSQARQLPRSLLGCSSGPPTTSHVRPSVAPYFSAKPRPEHRGAARQQSERSRSTTKSSKPDSLLIWINPAVTHNVWLGYYFIKVTNSWVKGWNHPSFFYSLLQSCHTFCDGFKLVLSSTFLKVINSFFFSLWLLFLSFFYVVRKFVFVLFVRPPNNDIRIICA